MSFRGSSTVVRPYALVLGTLCALLAVACVPQTRAGPPLNTAPRPEARIDSTRARRDPNLARHVESFGIGQGSSLLGFDEEHLITRRLGAQLGAGLIGFDAGLTLHFAPGIRTHHLLLGYFHYGLGLSNTRFIGAVGASLVFRDSGLLTMQVGLGRIVITDERASDPFSVRRGSDPGRGDLVAILSLGVCPRGH